MSGIEIKTESELGLMRQAGKVIAGLFRAIESEVKPGITTAKLDELAERYIRKEGGIPAFKGYLGFPSTICASVNEEVVHGIPGPRVLKEGDLIGIDVGVSLEGFYSDAARTYAVGRIDEANKRLIDVTREALKRGIEQAIVGNRVGDISAAVQGFAESHGFSVVREYVGHGIGRNLHEEPQVPNHGTPKQGPKLVEGMALAIEPMINMGKPEVKVLSDGWTVVTKDGSRSGHFEQTLFVGKEKAEVVTE